MAWESSRPWNPRHRSCATSGHGRAELVHVDIKLLGKIGRIGHRITGDRRSRVRGIGWEYVHVAIDDASRLAYVEVLEDQKGLTAVGFFERARRWFEKRRIAIERVMTDNGSASVSKCFRQACKRWSIRHLRTKPYRPETNGKAERFIQTLIRGWAYLKSTHQSAAQMASLLQRATTPPSPRDDLSYGSDPERRMNNPQSIHT